MLRFVGKCGQPQYAKPEYHSWWPAATVSSSSDCRRRQQSWQATCGKGAVVQQDLRKQGPSWRPSLLPPQAKPSPPSPPPLSSPPPPPPWSMQQVLRQQARERHSNIVRPAPLPRLTDVPDALLPALCDQFAVNCLRSRRLCDRRQLGYLIAKVNSNRTALGSPTYTTSSTRVTHRTLGTTSDLFRGRWLQFMGDSSMRGLWLSLYQQLVSGTRANPRVMDLRRWAKIVEPYNRSLRSVAYEGESVQLFTPFTWIDVILEEHSNGWRVQQGNWYQGIAPIPQAVLQAGGDAWGFGVPFPDQTDLLTPRWCNRMRSRSKSYIRLTYQFVTQTKFVADCLADNYVQWRTSACRGERVASGPDAVLLTTGAWDIAAGTPPAQSRTSLARALAAMRSESQLSGRLVGFASVYFEMGVTDVRTKTWYNITWQRAIVDEVNAGSNRGHVAFIDRALPINILQMLAPNCFRTTASRFVPTTTLELEVALEDTSGNESMEDTHVWHPPMAASIVLLPTLLELWLGSRRTCDYGDYRSVAPATCRMIVDLLTSNGSDTGREQCCGKRPLPGDLDDGHTEFTSYLSLQCRRRPANVSSMCPSA